MNFLNSITKGTQKSCQTPIPIENLTPLPPGLNEFVAIKMSHKLSTA